MALLTQFKLGRPGAEATFEVNPTAVDWNHAALKDQDRALDGALQSVTLSKDRPSIKISGNYITPAQFNQFKSLMIIDDTLLNFIYTDFTGDDIPETWEERVIAATTSTIIIPETSALLASKLSVDAGGATLAQMVGIWAAYAAGRTGTGTNLWTGHGSYSDTAYTITFDNAPLTPGTAYFVTYQCKALAVNLTVVPGRQEAGWVNKKQYDLELTGG